MRVIIGERAEEDLARFFACLAAHCDIGAAERFRVRAEESLKLLLQHPLIGPHPSWATRHERLRFWVISRTRYVFYHEVQEDVVSIERVLDGRRDVRRIIEQGIEEVPDDEH